MTPLLFLLMPWYVSDAEDAEALRAALDKHWSGEPVEVVVGEPPPGGEGTWLEGDTLVWSSQEREVRQAAPPSLTAQVLLVRSWSMALEPVDGGWVPPHEPLELPPEPEEPAEPAVTSWEPSGLTALSLGAGLRSSVYSPPARVGLEVAGYFPRVSFSATLGGDFNGRTSDGLGRVHRVGMLGGVGLDLSRPGGRGELWGLVGNRWLLVTHDGGVADRALMPALGVRGRWWARPFGSFSVGGGLSLLGELVPDGGAEPLPWDPELHASHSPWSLYLEIHVGRFR